MKPHIGRHDHGADFPFILLRLLALRPHQRKTFAREHDHVRARPVGVALLVGADGELRNVRVHRALAMLKRIWPPPAPRSAAVIKGMFTASGTKLVASKKPFCSPLALK